MYRTKNRPSLSKAVEDFFWIFFGNGGYAERRAYAVCLPSRISFAACTKEGFPAWKIATIFGIYIRGRTKLTYLLVRGKHITGKGIGRRTTLTELTHLGLQALRPSFLTDA